MKHDTFGKRHYRRGGATFRGKLGLAGDRTHGSSKVSPTFLPLLFHVALCASVRPGRRQAGRWQQRQRRQTSKRVEDRAAIWRKRWLRRKRIHSTALKTERLRTIQGLGLVQLMILYKRSVQFMLLQTMPCMCSCIDSKVYQRFECMALLLSTPVSGYLYS